MGGFSYVSVTALFCYGFLMMMFMAAEKNKLIARFMGLMVAMICWTGGSMLMRFLFWPSYEFWFHVSIVGLLMLPYCYFLFICEMAEKREKSASLAYLALIGVTAAVNCATGFFLNPPEVIRTGGNIRFIYHEKAPVVWLFVICGIIIVHTFLIIFREYGKNRKLKKQYNPVIAGIALLFIAHILLMLPVFKGIPIDIIAGVLNAFLLFYALVRKHLFQLKMLASSRVCYGAGLLLALALFYAFSPYLMTFFEEYQGEQTVPYPLVCAALFALIVMILTSCWQAVVRNVFVKDELLQADAIRDFSVSVSKSLRLDEILEKTVHVIQNTTAVRDIYICLPDEKTGDYRAVYSSQPLHDLSFEIRGDNPMIVWLKENRDSLLMWEFQTTTEYRALWEEEKNLYKKLEVQCCIGFRSEDSLAGLLLLSGKGKKERINFREVNMLESISSIVSIALQNAKLYEKAYHEAVTDELTGLLNRRHFYEILEQEFEKNRNSSLVLVIINVDDFKLYNQLYGAAQGDIALRNISGIIQATVGNGGIVARYSGKEFAILLPGYDVYAARSLTESIRKQIMHMDRDCDDYRLKALTISAGISAAPYGASSATELLNNADMAVYHVKNNGKNGIQIFDVRVQDEPDSHPGYANVKAYHDYETTIYALTAAIDTKDHYTFSHSRNVAYYGMELAKEMGLNQDIVEIVRQAGLLHDIGKIGIPEEILNKPGKLSAEEYEVIKGHVEASIGIIRHLPSLDYVIPAVIGHHERYDGNGYPRRIKGEDIPITARILCIVDSFDAMISKRSYKSSMPVEKALKILEEEAGHQFDPYLAPIFVSCIREGRIKPVVDEETELMV